MNDGMKEEKWLEDLRSAAGSSEDGARLASIWAKWAISQLEPKLRDKAARAWRQGKNPTEAGLNLGLIMNKVK